MEKHMTVALVITATLGILVGIIVGVLLTSAFEAKGHALVAPFSDTVNHPYAWAIEKIRLAGLTAGCQTEPAMFCPDRPITRGEMAVMLARMLDR